MGKRVLLVDWDSRLQGLYRNALESEGYSVVTASDPKEALSYLPQGRFDAIVLELQVTDGLDLDYLSEFLGSNRNLKVIINSCHPEFRNDFRTWIADIFLTKSQDTTELKKAIHGLLDSQGLRESRNYPQIRESPS